MGIHLRRNLLELVLHRMHLSGIVKTLSDSPRRNPMSQNCRCLRALGLHLFPSSNLHASPDLILQRRRMLRSTVDSCPHSILEQRVHRCCLRQHVCGEYLHGYVDIVGYRGAVPGATQGEVPGQGRILLHCLLLRILDCEVLETHTSIKPYFVTSN